MENLEESFSLARRILRDLRIIFEREPNLLEFDIIPVEEKIYNKSPVILQDHRLALESWSIKHLYQYSYYRFFQNRNNNQFKTDKSSLNEWTRCLLLINPDLYTAWNCRKQLILDGLVNIHEEFKFSELILKRRHKAPENFNHRQWLIRQLVKSGNFDDNLISYELGLCYEAANRYQSNYYAWNHRRWIMKEFGDNLESCMDELATTKDWVQKHISDYSGFSYRQFVFQMIRKFLGESTKSKNSSISYYSLLLDEIIFINTLFKVHHNRESLYIHRRFVLEELNRLYCDHKEELIENEIQFVKHHSQETLLVRRHINWCYRVLKWFSIPNNSPQ